MRGVCTFCSLVHVDSRKGLQSAVTTQRRKGATVTMYKRILVPLDGSPLAEQILPAVEHLASKLNTRVDLLSVVEEDVDAAVGTILRGRYRGKGPMGLVAIAENYLAERADRMQLPEGQVQRSVIKGSVAEAILKEASKRRDTLIAMSTHGRSGVGRFAMGSVADKVLHATKMPLLLYRPGLNMFSLDAGEISTVIVPLDGSELAEQVLPHVVELAAALPLKVLLVRVTSYPMAYYYGDEAPYLVPEDFSEETEKEALKYLALKAKELRKEGCQEVDTWHFIGTAAQQIIDLAKETSQSFVALTTHGRSGLGRWVLGSVADRVIQQSGVPVLVIRAK